MNLLLWTCCSRSAAHAWGTRALTPILILQQLADILRWLWL